MSFMASHRATALALLAAALTAFPARAPAQSGHIDASMSSEWESTAFNNGRRIVRDTNGYLHAVWHTSTTLPSAPLGYGCQIMYAFTLAPATEPPSMAQQNKWSPPFNMTQMLEAVDNRYPSVAIENAEYDSGQWKATNNLHVVWQSLPDEGGRYEINYATIPVNNPPLPPPPWFLVTNLSSTPTDSLVPAICINRYGPGPANQHVHVVWQEEDINWTGVEQSPPEDAWFSDIAYIRSADSGATWSGPAGGWNGNLWDNITSTPANSQMPSIACIQDRYTTTPAVNGREELGYDSSGLHVAYNEDVGIAGIKVFYQTSINDGQNWLPRINLTSAIRGYSGNEAYPNIAVDMADMPHIAVMTGVLVREEPLRTGPPANRYLAGIDPTLDRSFPGPGVGMYGAAVNQIWYYEFNGAGWSTTNPGSVTQDDEFPTVALDRWMHVNVNWQGYNTVFGDYDVYRSVRLNANNPSFPVVPPFYFGWNGPILDDSLDPARDDLFPNLAFKKSAMYFSPHEGPRTDPLTLAGYDEVWTKIPGHGQQDAIQPVIPREIWQDGNMTYDVNVPVSFSAFFVD